ncbi:MAG: site-specific integrase [Ruminococcaceae bacterium]|nr:site-specific integrase [Oscillospiraceae bacterium]
MKNNIIIRKRKSVKKGFTYEYRFETAPVGGQRKWISKGGFENEELARVEGIKALNEYNACGKVVEPTSMSFADFLEHWIVNDCSAILNEVTIQNYRKKIKNLIAPTLGKYKVNTIDRDKLQNLLVYLHNNGYSSNTLSAVKGILTKCFNYAIYSNYLAKSPALSLKIPKNENTDVPTRISPHIYLTRERIASIFERFPVSSSSHLPLMIGLHCGLRLGETFALTWDDVHLHEKKISINKQIQWRQYQRTEGEKKQTNGKAVGNSGCWYFTSTKYKSDRVIEIDDELFTLLSAEKEKQEKAASYFADRYTHYYQTERKEITTAPTDKEIHFVCVREDGTYITPRTMQHTSRVIHNELNIKEFDFHSLRHTHATVLLENDAPLKYIQQRLGHKKIDVTLNVYQHLTDDLRNRGTNVLNNIFIGNLTKMSSKY